MNFTRQQLLYICDGMYQVWIADEKNNKTKFYLTLNLLQKLYYQFTSECRTKTFIRFRIKEMILWKINNTPRNRFTINSIKRLERVLDIYKCR